MSDITLKKGQFQLVINGDVPLFDLNGNFVVQNIQDNNIIAMPISDETLKFFNIYLLTEEESSTCDTASSSDVCKQAEQSKSAAYWKDDNEVRCLIYFWQDHQDLFKKMKSRDVRSTISKKLNENNLEWKKTYVQCENKWKDIKRKYTKTKEHNSKSGNNPKTCKFYDELDEILGEKPCVKPITGASNLKRHSLVESCKKQDDSDILNENSDSSSLSEKPCKKKKKKMTRMERELKDWSAVLLADAKTREEAREQCHRETIAETKTGIDVYKKMMEKLIEKL